MPIPEWFKTVALEKRKKMQRYNLPQHSRILVVSRIHALEFLLWKIEEQREGFSHPQLGPLDQALQSNDSAILYLSVHAFNAEDIKLYGMKLIIDINKETE